MVNCTAQRLLYPYWNPLIFAAKRVWNPILIEDMSISLFSLINLYSCVLKFLLLSVSTCSIIVFLDNLTPSPSWNGPLFPWLHPDSEFYCFILINTGSSALCWLVVAYFFPSIYITTLFIAVYFKWISHRQHYGSCFYLIWQSLPFNWSV